MDCDGLWRIVTITSFADAKSWEYGLKYVGGGDGARDGAEMRDAFAEVLGHEVAG